MSEETLQDTIEKMPAAKIAEYIAKAEADMEHAKLRLVMFNGELERRYKPQFASAFADKPSGEKTIECDGLSLKGEISKTVKWDSRALMNVAAEMPWDRVREIFKIEFSVPEATYNALAGANPDLFANIAAARTVKYGDLKVKIAKK
jgi:hypothetical protein